MGLPSSRKNLDLWAIQGSLSDGTPATAAITAVFADYDVVPQEGKNYPFLDALQPEGIQIQKEIRFEGQFNLL